MTRLALMKYQKALGLEQVGFAGPQTRAKLGLENAAGAGAAIEPVKPAVPSGISKLNKMLKKGMRSADVVLLQQLLNKDPETAVALSGDGSPGFESDYFGPLTLKALQKFQVKHGIANPSDEGYGLVGPKTRAKLNQI